MFLHTNPAGRKGNFGKVILVCVTNRENLNWHFCVQDMYGYCCVSLTQPIKTRRTNTSKRSTIGA
jgi:hypothetical protein